MTIALYPHEAPPRFHPQMARAIEFLVAHFRDHMDVVRRRVEAAGGQREGVDIVGNDRGRTRLRSGDRNQPRS